MSIKSALELARTKAVALNLSSVTFTRHTKTITATGGFSHVDTTYAADCRIVKPSYARPNEQEVRMGGNSVDADWLVLFALGTTGIQVGDTFTHPLNLTPCVITGVELRGMEGESVVLTGLAKEVSP